MLLHEATNVVGIELGHREHLLGLRGHPGVVDDRAGDSEGAKFGLVLSDEVKAFQNHGSKLWLSVQMPHKCPKVALAHLLEKFDGRGFVKQFQGSENFELALKVKRVKVKTVLVLGSASHF